MPMWQTLAVDPPAGFQRASGNQQELQARNSTGTIPEKFYCRDALAEIAFECGLPARETIHFIFRSQAGGTYH